LCGARCGGGTLGGFPFFNFYPGSIFMGGSGALPMGFMLGALGLRGAALQSNSHLSCAVFPVLVMLVPPLDASIVTMSRLATGNPISRRGLDHSHHRPLMLGLATGFHWMLIAADGISEDRLAIVKAFADAHHLPLQRFSIEVNEFVPGLANASGIGAGKGVVAESGAPAVARPSAA